MHTDLDAPAPPPEQWSSKKLLLIALCILAVFITAILSYDSKLEPYDDLVPAVVKESDVGTNGYFFLKERWEKLPAVSKPDEEKASGMMSEKTPWDSAFFEKLSIGQKNMASELKTALAMPEFSMPRVVSINDDPFEGQWVIKHIRRLTRQLAVFAHEGNSAAAIDLLRDLHQFSFRGIDASSTLISLLTIAAVQSVAAAKTCDLLEQLKLDDSQAAALSKIWEAGPDYRAAWKRAMIGESAWSRSALEAMKNGGALPGTPLPGMPPQALVALLIKKNQTLNRIHQHNRQLIKVGFNVFPSKQAAQSAGWAPLEKRNAGIGRYLNPNFISNSMYDPESFLRIIPSLTDKFFFQPRALQVRIAIYRWRLKHPGQWPAKLDELVPEFLPEIPADPWNGKPLTWEPTSHFIQAVGSDWKTDVPKFRSTTDWFSTEYEFPGLRCELPSAPPITAPASPP